MVHIIGKCYAYQHNVLKMSYNERRHLLYGTCFQRKIFRIGVQYLALDKEHKISTDVQLGIGVRGYI